MSAEEDSQCAFIAWRDYAARDVAPRAAKLARIYHTPNGGARSARTGARLARMGVRRGIPDLLGPFAGHGAYAGYVGWAVELKAPRGRVSREQRMVLEELASERWWVHVFEDWTLAAAAAVAYLGLPGRMAPGPDGEWPDIRLAGEGG